MTTPVTLGDMSISDQRLSSTLQGTALMSAHDDRLRPLIGRLTATAGERPDLRAEVAGTLAGHWFASPRSENGLELVAAGMTILAGAVDGSRLLRWVRAGIATGAIGAVAAHSLADDHPKPRRAAVLTSTGEALAAEALLLSTDESLQPLVDRLGAVAPDRPDLAAQVTGSVAGAWFAAPDEHQGQELIAAGLICEAAYIDPRELERWLHIGYQRRSNAPRK